VTVEAEEACLNWVPRFVSLVLTRYTQDYRDVLARVSDDSGEATRDWERITEQAHRGPLGHCDSCAQSA